MGYGVTARARRRGDRRMARPAVGLLGTVQVDGYGIAYRTAGSAEAHAHTLVLVHGVAGSSALWEDPMATLHRCAYLVAVDLPGHGLSEGPGASSVAEYTGFLLRLFDALGLRRPVVLVGHCLGACIALDLAARHPDRVLGLVLSGIGPGSGIDEAALAAAGRGEWDPLFWERRVLSSAAPAMARTVLRGWQSTRPEVRFGDLLARAQFDALAAAGRVQAPALVVVGAEDAWVAPPPAASALAAALPYGVQAHLAGAGPMPMLEAPDPYAETVAGFLAALRPGVPAPPAARRPRY